MDIQIKSADNGYIIKSTDPMTTLVAKDKGELKEELTKLINGSE